MLRLLSLREAAALHATCLLACLLTVALGASEGVSLTIGLAAMMAVSLLGLTTQRRRPAGRRAFAAYAAATTPVWIVLYLLVTARHTTHDRLPLWLGMAMSFSALVGDLLAVHWPSGHRAPQA